MNSNACSEVHYHFFVITLILVSIPVQSLSALMAYHLTCQHVKFSSSLLGDTPSAYHLLFLPKSFFLYLFFLLSFFHILCGGYFYVFIIQSTWNFPQSFIMSWSCVSTIFIAITHAWRHLGAILWFSDLVTWLIISSKRNIICQ